ncbi:MAG: NAD(+)/NADH kinase [Myxococcaceae bacterium]|nr:NAD(+)/NADH kinase [Myxococcaceae bacterium]
MKILGLVAKHDSEEAASLAAEIRDRYPDRVVLADEALSTRLGWPQPEPEETLIARADLVIVLGGDGTLIHAARLLRGRAVPILGINLGSLGFMTEIPRQDALATIDDVLDGKFRTESRLKLTVRLWRNGRVIADDEVLNDVVLNKGALARIVDYEMCIDGQYVTTYKADGVIVATPTGSTAYSLSAGGPIIHPMVDCMIVTPICPHALTQRPLVLPSERTVHLDLKEGASDVYLTLDGKSGYPMEPGDRVEVARSANRVLLVRNPKMGYFAILREKLRWGER